MDDDVKTWQWAATLVVTVILSMAGSLWSVGVMRADDMQRVAKAESEIANLKQTNLEIKSALIRIEGKVDSIRQDRSDRRRYGEAWNP